MQITYSRFSGNFFLGVIISDGRISFLFDAFFQRILENPDVSGADDNAIIVFQWSFSVDWGSIDQNPTVFFHRGNEGLVLLIGQLDDGMLVVNSIMEGCVKSEQLLR